MLEKNSMACSLSLALGSSMHDELASQIMVGHGSQNAWDWGKLKNINKVICESPTLLTTTKRIWLTWHITHDWHLGSNMLYTKHMGALEVS
jgi:hypothetical protein